jgi:hypothetical protein
MRTTECSCKLWPTPGMYEVTSIPFVRRTRATLRNAEFGFFGVEVYTRVHTPRFCGQLCSAGALFLRLCFSRLSRISWLIVGIGFAARSQTLYDPNYLNSCLQKSFKYQIKSLLSKPRPLPLGKSYRQSSPAPRPVFPPSRIWPRPYLRESSDP